MLDALRRGATGWLAKILIALLVVSFAVWGVADVFTGFGSGSVATVGSERISSERFQQSYRDELNAISERVGRRLTPEQARVFGLENSVMSRLIGTSAIEQHAHELNLRLSDIALAEGLQRDPSFRGPDGKFSRQGFEGLLRQLGLSEAGFLDLRRKDELRDQIISSLNEAVVAPKPVLDMLHAWKEETRVAEYFTIDAEKAAPVADPDDAKIKETYEANQSQFMTPEYRKLATLILSINDLTKVVKVPEDEMKAAYERDKDSYNTPEQRRIQQISFKDRQAADAAKKALSEGKLFGDVAKEAGMKDGDIDLGLLRKSQLIDPKIADVAFKLEKDGISDVIEGKFATVIVRTVQIQPAVLRTFEDVKTQVHDKLAVELAAADIRRLHDEVEDGRSAGKTLKEIGEALNLTFRELAAVSRDNKTPKDQKALDHPDANAIIAAGFEAQAGVEREPIEIASGGYAWVDLQGVTEPQLKPLDTVKDQVKALYISTERRRVLNDVAEKLVSRIDQGEEMAKLAADVGGTVEKTPNLTRTTVPQGFPEAGVAPLFALAKGRGGSVSSADDKTRVVFKLTEITPAAEPTKEQKEKLVRELGRDMQNDVIQSYVDGLRTKYGVNINQKEFRRALGTDTQ